MKIAIITGSRSDYFLLKNLIFEIKKIKKFKLVTIATGSLMSNFFGNLIKEIKKDKIQIDYSVDLLIKEDTENDVSSYISTGIKQFSEKFNKIQPNLIIIIGDRYESFAAAVSACINRFPIAHIHGGEVTNGALDNSLRHAITKFSHLHFVSNKIHAKRVYQLGEEKRRIFNVGALGVEAINKYKLLTQFELEKILKIKLKKKNILATFHPETLLNKKENLTNLKAFLSALEKVKNATVIFTLSNADTNFKIINRVIKKFCNKKKNFYFFKSLGHLKYFSLCSKVDFMIGNSSSGIIEMPAFKKPTINLGNRQEGRTKSLSIIDCEFKISKIIKNIDYCYDEKFLKKIRSQRSLYSSKNVSEKIIQVIQKTNLKDLIKKKFIDLKFNY